MSEFSVDAKGLFEVVGMFEEICRDCDQTGQILSKMYGDNGGIFRTESEGCTGLFRGY